MARTIVNLTASAIAQEIERVLKTYPEYPYQQTFAISQLHQKLITYVVGQVSSCYAVIDRSKQPSISFKPLPSSLDAGLDIEALIRQAIEHIVSNNLDYVNRQISQRDDPANLVPH